ncbi:hypothetical protein VIGAN_07164800 [Vigna angularis var. angularis]|uniref:Uncharacterized protein n=1 Tax=Vigna angularis var. angularis TaxID=157739 RepID=A0A0S3SJ12_PHAAN|nr:hypothetical protein VIGAN_07164800 [Vigna angularis var. angularis]
MSGEPPEGTAEGEQRKSVTVARRVGTTEDMLASFVGMTEGEQGSDGGCWQASWGRWWWSEMLLLGEEQRNPCAKRKKFDLKRFNLSPCSSLLLSFCF